MTNQPPRDKSHITDLAAASGMHLISSEVLLPKGRPLHIEHRGEIYMLRRTRSGKLILTK